MLPPADSSANSLTYLLFLEGSLVCLNGEKRYLNDIRSRTTVSTLAPGQIHQIGLREIDRVEADMLVIAHREGFAGLASYRDSLKRRAQPRDWCSDEQRPARRGANAARCGARARHGAGAQLAIEVDAEVGPAVGVRDGKFGREFGRPFGSEPAR